MNTNTFAPPPPPTPQPPMTAIPATLENQPTSSSAPVYDINDPFIQQEMIKQFCQASGMKAEWSEKCLKDMGWNFEVSFMIRKCYVIISQNIAFNVITLKLSIFAVIKKFY